MKHKEIAIQWLQGRTVQRRTRAGEWLDIMSPDEVSASFLFSDESEYRLKPDPTYRYVRCYKNRCNSTTFGTVYTANTSNVNLKLGFVDGKLVSSEVI